MASRGRGVIGWPSNCQRHLISLSLSLSPSFPLSIPFLIKNIFAVDHYVSILLQLCIINSHCVRDSIPFSSTLVHAHDDVGRHFVRVILVRKPLSFFSSSFSFSPSCTKASN